MQNGNLVETKNIKKYFPIVKKVGWVHTDYDMLHAVDGVDLSIGYNDSLGLVGESGCGKTTTARLIIRLLELTDGEVFFEGKKLAGLDAKEMLTVRKSMQMVFQDPYASLNPRRTVRDTVGNPLELHGMTHGKEETDERVRQLIKSVGLTPDVIDRFPHEFRGGMRQRITAVGIARAIATEPKLLVCDEPVSAVDVSMQARIINLLKDLQEEHQFSFLFIAHNLAVVQYICARTAVMYLGRIVELANRTEIFENPVHPYTKALVAAIPRADPTLARSEVELMGEVPSPINLPPGCRFRPRCNEAKKICETGDPPLIDVGDGHMVACYLHTG